MGDCSPGGGQWPSNKGDRQEEGTQLCGRGLGSQKISANVSAKSVSVNAEDA